MQKRSTPISLWDTGPGQSKAERAISTIEEHRDTMSSLHRKLHLVGEMDTPPPTPVAPANEDEESRHSDSEGMEVDEEEEGDPEEEVEEGPSDGATPGNNPDTSLPQSQDQDPAEGVIVDTTLPSGTELPTAEDDYILDGDDGPTTTTGSDALPAEFSGDLEGAEPDSPSAHQ